jgi:hypothetical protein
MIHGWDSLYIYSPQAIKNYAKLLIKKRFRDIPILEEDDKKVVGSIGNKAIWDSTSKGSIYMYEPNSSTDPDFLEAGVELKVPRLKLKNGELRPKKGSWRASSIIWRGQWAVGKEFLPS